MRILTITELFRLTRKELCELATRIRAALPDSAEEPVEHTAAIINLRNIRYVLARRDFSP
ncbi:MAG: hypothetical protein WDN02_11015 [Methylovirgula sp.]|uniref:hypothetical protein n=1 Tax=Methylovirgula sp. TaxID=1978224 RepID=UPI0030766E8B